ncbi:unnamed protein product [Phaedon cochleariae]|uniref:Uncharacterized protein n=1 Tax=Phaedon cochleariae TaxID=80249 RepID=A0A9P0DAA2_PHACE|nr:unnamed protein product [Phaedon cochleariae]
MNSMLINANLLKIPLQLSQRSPTSRHTLENLITLPKIANKIRIHVVRSFPKIKPIRYFSPFREKYLNPFITSYSLLEVSRLKKHHHPITNAQLNVQRNYCQKSIDKYNKFKQSDKSDHQKRDEVCGEDCITFEKEKIKKKHHESTKTKGISFNVNLNNIVNELSKKKDLQKLHEINKISNFIFKPIDCKACSSNKKKSSGKLTKSTDQKRSNSLFSVPQKVHPKYEMKREEFKKENYDETVNYNNSRTTELLSICLNKKYERKPNRSVVTLARKKSRARSDKKSQGPVPLVMLVKSNSGKTRALVDHYSNNIKYKVGTNEAFIKSTDTFLINNGSMKMNSIDLKRSRSEGDISKSNKLQKMFNEFSGKTEKDQLYQNKLKDNLAEVPKPVLAKAIYEMLKPLIEQEFLQYKEVKTAIHRLENNLETYFNQIIPNSHNINNSNIKENQFDLPEGKNKMIREPNTYINIADPSDQNYCKKDPTINNVISAPSMRNLEILDPIEYEIVIIAQNCGKKDGSQSKKDGTKKLKAQLCENNEEKPSDKGKKSDEQKKEDPCQKDKHQSKPANQLCDDKNKKTPVKADKQDNKTANPCVNKLKTASDTDKTCKKRPANQLCDEAKKKDPCQKDNKQDTSNNSKKQTKSDCTNDRRQQEHKKDPKQESKCQNEAKEDPCQKNNKQDPCKKAKQEIKSKKDSCQDENKQDPCKKAKQEKKCKDDNKKEPCKENNKQDPCGKSKQENKCDRKKDPCKKTNDETDDSCCLKAKKKGEDFCETDISKYKQKSPSNTKEDSCKDGTKRDPSSEQSSKNCKKEDDPCSRFKGIGPSEETCKKVECFNPMPCCEKASICQEPTLPSMKSKGPDGQSKTESHKPDICKRNPDDVSNCKQRSCTQKSMEPTEPPNCCKPLGRKGFYDKPCSDLPQTPKTKIDVKQVCCQEIISKEQEAAKALERKNAPARPKPLPPKVEPPPKCDPPSKTDTRYCTKPTIKAEVSVPKPEVKCTRMPAPAVPQNIVPKPVREPKQAPKDSWFPVKIRTKQAAPKPCESKPKKYTKTNEDTPLPPRSPKLTAQLPKQEPPKKNLLDNCKGLFSSICRVFCPSKNKPGKKGASSSVTNSNSMPELKGTFGGFSSSAPAGSSGNKPNKKPGTMTFAIYRKRNRYPWNTAPRWSIYQERFISKKSKEDSDPCKTKEAKDSEQDKPDSNKLQCICYEEIKKKQASKENSGDGKHGDRCKKKTDKQMTFKPTNHSKICQMESKKKSASKKCKSNSEKADQSKFKQCGELCKQNTGDNKSSGKANSSDTSTTKKSKNVCADKLKTSGTTTKDKPKSTCAETSSTTTKDKPKSTCAEKPKSASKDDTKERKTFKERCLSKSNSKNKSCSKKHEEFKEMCKPKSDSKQNDCTKEQEQSKQKSTSPKKDKYPWKKSDDKMDGDLCANESNITKKSMEDEKAKTKTENSGGKNQQGNLLKSEQDSSCFRDYNKNSEKGKKVEKRKSDVEAAPKPDCKRMKKEVNKEDDSKSSKNTKEGCKPKEEEQGKNMKKVCAQPKPCQNKGDEDQKKASQKISCQNKVKNIGKKSEDKKKCDDAKKKKTADKKESVCERMKETKKCDGKESFIPKKSESDKPKGICDKIREKKKSKEEMGKSISQKCTSSTGVTKVNSNKMGGIEDVELDGDKHDMFICKVKSLGKSEQLICSSKSDKPQKMEFNEKGVLRILKCRLTKDENGREVFVCKEIKPDKDKNEIIQEELQQMKDLLKQRSAPNLSQNQTIVSKKLICQEEPDGAKVCNIKDVKEIVEGGRSKKVYVKPAPKKCPFTYQDLLKKSEEIRKAASERTLEERNKKTKDVKRAASVPRVKPKKINDC